MFRTILVPVDGSPLAEHAIPWALSAADPTAAVHLAHVHLPPVPIVVEGVVVADPTLDATLRAQESEYLAGLVNRVRTARPGQPILTASLDTDQGLPAALAATVLRIGADLVVMTTHGRGAFARFLLGSVADDTFRVSPAPVLVVRGPAGQSADFTARSPLREVVVPVDGSPLAESILGPAVKLARAFLADITLLMVSDAAVVPAVSNPPDSVNPITPARQSEITLDRLARDLGEKGVTASTKLVKHGDPATVILEYAKSRPGAAIALATHARTGLSRLLHGSVADTVVHGADGPVLVYHPPH